LGAVASLAEAFLRDGDAPKADMAWAENRPWNESLYRGATADRSSAF
jgi:hypothetical protein